VNWRFASHDEDLSGRNQNSYLTELLHLQGKLISVQRTDLTMSLSTHVHHASYPYYDPPLTDEQQDQIDDLLAPLLPNTTKEHPSLSALPLPASRSPFWQLEYDRISQNRPLNAVDPSKYQLSADLKSNLVSTEYLWSRTD